MRDRILCGVGLFGRVRLVGRDRDHVGIGGSERVRVCDVAADCDLVVDAHQLCVGAVNGIGDEHTNVVAELAPDGLLDGDGASLGVAVHYGDGGRVR